MIRAFALLVAALLAAPAAGFTPDRAVIFVDALRANGCAMTGDEAPQALEPLGLEASEVQSFVDILFGAELVTLSDDQSRLMLTDALCQAAPEGSQAMVLAAYAAADRATVLERWAPDFTPERGAMLVGALRTNGCAMSEAQAAEILPALGFQPIETRDVVSILLETALATIADQSAGGAITLAEALCAADPAHDSATMAQALNDWAAADALAAAGEGTE